MIITKPTIVYYNGLEYKLFPKGINKYYLTPNDGLAPNGQIIHANSKDLDKMFTLKKDK